MSKLSGGSDHEWKANTAPGRTLHARLLSPLSGVVVQINCSQSILEERESYTVNNGRFEKDGITVGPNGITSRSPDDCHNFDSIYSLEDFDLLEMLGRVGVEYSNDL